MLQICKEREFIIFRYFNNLHKYNKSNLINYKAVIVATYINLEQNYNEKKFYLKKYWYILVLITFICTKTQPWYSHSCTLTPVPTHLYLPTCTPSLVPQHLYPHLYLYTCTSTPAPTHLNPHTYTPTLVPPHLYPQSPTFVPHTCTPTLLPSYLYPHTCTSTLVRPHM